MARRINFDGTLKAFFQKQPPSLLMDLTGGVPVREWLNVELPRVQERKADLVLLLADDSLLHIEFQSTNRRDMALRMAEYCLLLWSKYRRPIRQVVLYVGSAPARMGSRLELGTLRFEYALRDIRDWPAEAMLRSDKLGDQVLAILGGTSDAEVLVREIVERLRRLSGREREWAIACVGLLSGLRRFERILVRETRHMGLVIDWTNNEILKQIGEEGFRRALRSMLATSFPRIPKWADQRIERASLPQMEGWLAKVRDAKKIEDVLGPR